MDLGKPVAVTILVSPELIDADPDDMKLWMGDSAYGAFEKLLSE